MMSRWYGGAMTMYKLLVTMPDGGQPDFPDKTLDEVIQYLDAVRATYDQDPESVAAGGSAKSTYTHQDDTTITWHKIEASDG